MKYFLGAMSEKLKSSIFFVFLLCSSYSYCSRPLDRLLWLGKDLFGVGGIRDYAGSFYPLMSISCLAATYTLKHVALSSVVSQGIDAFYKQPGDVKMAAGFCVASAAMVAYVVSDAWRAETRCQNAALQGNLFFSNMIVHDGVREVSLSGAEEISLFADCKTIKKLSSSLPDIFTIDSLNSQKRFSLWLQERAPKRATSVPIIVKTVIDNEQSIFDQRFCAVRAFFGAEFLPQKHLFIVDRDEVYSKAAKFDRKSREQHALSEAYLKGLFQPENEFDLQFKNTFLLRQQKVFLLLYPVI